MIRYKGEIEYHNNGNDRVMDCELFDNIPLKEIEDRAKRLKTKGYKIFRIIIREISF